MQDCIFCKVISGEIPSKEVYSDECSGCMACVDSCPVNKTLEIKVVSRKRNFSKMKWAAILVIFFWGSLLTFKLFGPWQNSITDEEYMKHIPSINSQQYSHP